MLLHNAKRTPRNIENAFMIRNILTALPAVALLGCLTTTYAAETTHEYTVSVNPSLTELDVRARFSTPIRTLTARGRDAADYLIAVSDCERSRSLKLRNRRMLLPDIGLSCLEYTVDLERAAQDERRNLSLSDENVLVSPSLWLWRPELDGSTQLNVRFVLPDDVQIAVPWAPIPGRDHEYRLSASPESANAPALFGQFTAATIDLPGATLTVSLPQTEPALDQSLMIDWLTATARDVTLTYGRFPNPSAHVIVIPIGQHRWGSQRAVPFGRVIRDGGEVIELFVNGQRPAHEYFKDWTATHEFSHLMLPYVDGAHRWISEGFAQYYQNVLLARSGAYEQAEAWQKLHAGLERGQASRPGLSPNAAASRGVRGARMKVYWTGAALALMADVTLRQRSGNRETLDDVLERLQSCCLPSARVWTGPELFERMDELVEEPVFMPLYRRYADTVGFPGTETLFEQLGVHVANDRLSFRDGAELADLRRAITAAAPEAVAQRKTLAGGR